MCGIAGIISRKGAAIPDLSPKLITMEQLLAHRGPDGVGLWHNDADTIGLAHRRLSIIDLSAAANQPMRGPDGNVLVSNGEIYNYRELQSQFKNGWDFQSNSDTEVILAAYNKLGFNCLDLLRGMFAFGLYDTKNELFFAARDRFGIKPFYYLLLDDYFIFASEVKALLPFITPEIDPLGFSEYLTFQTTIGSTTLFKHIKQLPPAHCLTLINGKLTISRYWEVTKKQNESTINGSMEQIKSLLEDSVRTHLVSDAPVGSYLSGGIDSSLICAIASSEIKNLPFFHGKFSAGPDYDESCYAQLMASRCEGSLHISDISVDDFIQNINQIIYHLDYPVAGPGAFPQYLVSKNASRYVKVILAGQGGDELFGGYARYLIAYLDQCLNAAIDGSYQDNHYEIKFGTLINQLNGLKSYKPLIKQFWSQGLFDNFDQRYFRLIDRSNDVTDEINWHELDRDHSYQVFQMLFNQPQNKTSYLDQMMQFDFNYLLPGLLHVEDRVSMAHGLESRVPFLDHRLVELVTNIPAAEKFQNGELKSLLRSTFKQQLPIEIVQRQDKMGFPVPLTQWLGSGLREFMMDIFATGKNRHRQYINYDAVIKHLDDTGQYSRKLWAFLSLELWQQQFLDGSFQSHINKGEGVLA